MKQRNKNTIIKIQSITNEIIKQNNNNNNNVKRHNI